MDSPSLRQQTQYIFAGTFRNILSGFIIDRQTRGLSKGTIHYYQDELNRFSSFLDSIGVVQLEEITPDILRIYLLQLSQTRNKGGVHASYRAIRALFFWYEDEFEPDDWKNPIKKVKVASPSKNPLPGVSIEDIQKMVECSNTRDKAILLCLLDSGARASEFISLNIEDTDLILGSIKIKYGKGGKSRIVFLGKTSRKALRKYLKDRTSVTPSSPLFVTDENERLSYPGLVNIIRRRSKDANIKTPGLHDFRRCFAIEMLRGGCDLARLAELMGHSSLEVLRRYLHLIDDDLRQIHSQSGPVDRNFK